MASARSSMPCATPGCPAIRSRTITPSIAGEYGRECGCAGTAARLAVLSGQPGLLVLDQLEQRGLHLLHVGDLVEHQLPMLARRLDHQPAAAEHPVDQPMRERHVADPDQREGPAGPGQDAVAQPEPAGARRAAGWLSAP